MIDAYCGVCINKSMSETERRVDDIDQLERQMADNITAIVEWLSVVENPDHFDGQAERLAYCDAPQMGPVRHGGAYVGRHKSYGENPEDDSKWWQICLLYPEDYRWEHNETLLQLCVSNGNVLIGDEEYSKYTHQTATQFIDWLASAPLALTARSDSRQW